MGRTSILCPRCEHDYLMLMRVDTSGEEFYSCPECDATWAGTAPRSKSNFAYYSDFLAERGLVNDDGVSVLS